MERSKVKKIRKDLRELRKSSDKVANRSGDKSTKGRRVQKGRKDLLARVRVAQDSEIDIKDKKISNIKTRLRKVRKKTDAVANVPLKSGKKARKVAMDRKELLKRLRLTLDRKI